MVLCCLSITDLIPAPVSQLLCLKFPGEERIIGGWGASRGVFVAALEPQTGSLLNIQVHIKGTSNFKASSQPMSCSTQTSIREHKQQ